MATLSSNRPSGFLQIPVRSGLPSAVFGAGAVRLGLPLGVRGVLGNGTFHPLRKKNGYGGSYCIHERTISDCPCEPRSVRSAERSARSAKGMRRDTKSSRINEKGPSSFDEDGPLFRCRRRAPLLSSKLEVCFRRAVIPSAGNGAIVRTDILEFAVTDEVGRIPFFILAIGFDVDSPL